jgi:hypothetical protein
MYKILLTFRLIFLAYFELAQAFKVWQSMNQKQVPQILKNRCKETKRWRYAKMIEERMKSVWKTFILNFDKMLLSIKKKKSWTQQLKVVEEWMMMSLLVVAEPIIKMSKKIIYRR